MLAGLSPRDQQAHAYEAIFTAATTAFRVGVADPPLGSTLTPNWMALPTASTWEPVVCPTSSGPGLRAEESPASGIIHNW
jgi:hypothetical protein